MATITIPAEYVDLYAGEPLPGLTPLSMYEDGLPWTWHPLRPPVGSDEEAHLMPSGEWLCGACYWRDNPDGYYGSDGKRQLLSPDEGRVDYWLNDEPDRYFQCDRCLCQYGPDA